MNLEGEEGIDVPDASKYLFLLVFLINIQGLFEKYRDCKHKIYYNC